MTGAVWVPANGYENSKTAPVWRIACAFEVKPQPIPHRCALKDSLLPANPNSGSISTVNQLMACRALKDTAY